MCIINEGRKNMNRNKTLEFAELLLNNYFFKQLSIKTNLMPSEICFCNY